MDVVVIYISNKKRTHSKAELYEGGKKKKITLKKAWSKVSGKEPYEKEKLENHDKLIYWI